ncbi:PhzF family phenazine biosynthesis protein [Pontibacter harenae]|uniref:PhzF family phenazine biosynthesis protein n=1 Tax=Pontibacter harenae TaxID=2894083 RepID=UPI001E4A483D|nr:PhzF family phenazine biosynthesis protein [Pontibacter harenae]MCC9167283.1 PhzF family phenazine biosynthesis protein [Pontibacter harenae]
MKAQDIPALYLVKAFTDSAVGGNAAGVVLNADKLTKDRKQSIAANLGLSETAFVSASEVGDVKVEFFTPNRQIPHCGHATVATFGLLLHQGLVKGKKAIKESIEGPRQIMFENGKIFQSQLAPNYTALSETTVTQAEIAVSLGLPEDYSFSATPMVANTGVSFLLVPVEGEQQLRALVPDQEKIKAISDHLDLVGYYVFTTDLTHADATARMFAPSYGIPEESATGMAAGPLACYLHDYAGFSKTKFLIQQGYLMQPSSPSQIEVTLDVDANENIIGLRAGGYAFVVEQLMLE